MGASKEAPGSFSKVMQAHGLKKGPSKRHPVTNHYKAPPVDQAAYRKFK